jgi:myo-inositol-1(or 4)-monophosphatase
LGTAVSDLAGDHALALDAVRAGGALALQHFRTDVKRWEKSPDDWVSQADKDIDALLRRRLTEARPDYGWLSEETEDDVERLNRRRVWVVDPIDGTRAYLKDLPEFTVCIALVEDGRPVVAAVFNPATGELFDAVAGGGARLNGQAIEVSHRPDFEGAKLLAGWRMFQRAGYTEPPTDLQFKSINSIAYRMALVACGRYDGCVSLNGKSDWDIAAAELLVLEAGGKVTTTGGEGFRYNTPEPRHNSLILGGAAMHDRLLRFIATVPRPPGAAW